jgi:hypothetical protein
MAGIFAVCATAADVSTGTSNKTILSITAPANTPIVINEVSISFRGVSPTADKILVQGLRTASGGTGSTTNNPTQFNASEAESPQTTGARDFSSGAHSGTEVFQETVHPQAGYTWRPRRPLKVKKGETFAINVTAIASVNCRARIEFEE